MYKAGLANVSIKDEAGHQIDGDELLDCIMGKKKIAEDLKVAYALKKPPLQKRNSPGLPFPLISKSPFPGAVRNWIGKSNF